MIVCNSLLSTFGALEIWDARSTARVRLTCTWIRIPGEKPTHPPRKLKPSPQGVGLGLKFRYPGAAPDWCSGDDPPKHGVWQFTYACCIASLGTYVYESLVLYMVMCTRTLYEMIFMLRTCTEYACSCGGPTLVAANVN